MAGRIFPQAPIHSSLREAQDITNQALVERNQQVEAQLDEWQDQHQNAEESKSRALLAYCDDLYCWEFSPCLNHGLPPYPGVIIRPSDYKTPHPDFKLVGDMLVEGKSALFPFEECQQELCYIGFWLRLVPWYIIQLARLSLPHNNIHVVVAIRGFAAEPPHEFCGYQQFSISSSIPSANAPLHPPRSSAGGTYVYALPPIDGMDDQKLWAYCEPHQNGFAIMNIPDVMPPVYYRTPTFEIRYRLLLSKPEPPMIQTLTEGFGTVIREHLRLGLLSGGRFWPPLLNFIQDVHQAGALHLLKKGTSSLSVAKRVFREITALSDLNYESAGVKENAIVFMPASSSSVVDLEFATPTCISDSRAARKLLVLSSSTLALAFQPKQDGSDPPEPFLSSSPLSGNEFHLHLPRAIGLCSITDQVCATFVSRGVWQVGLGATPLYTVANKVTSIVTPNFGEHKYAEAFQNVFREQMPDQLNSLCQDSSQQRHGTMIVISSEAAKEAERLEGQSTRIIPRPIDEKELTRLCSGIDGAILVDPTGICHAIGVILDGMAVEGGTRARGARYNSAVRYVAFCKQKGHRVLAVVFSEDRTIDFIPSPIATPEHTQQQLQWIQTEIANRIQGIAPSDAVWVQSPRPLHLAPSTKEYAGGCFTFHP